MGTGARHGGRNGMADGLHGSGNGEFARIWPVESGRLRLNVVQVEQGLVPHLLTSVVLRVMSA